ncbi:MAG: VOC family protein [Pseudomonadales bacterium]|jgi:catechol 2,3-dioxygenase-like lactoylglutathione lyase family enzyme|nr:VOC family protein [Pseudomonadales bacterium]MDP6469736.1 VOC family protein [Pseudomonadales bacterium]MDP6827663.1 VOC family protein [Pseudomonadales bacterium]MDP6971897.1 VOC family protein [Pseudomonadales bacterium]|tara:strand:- start:815 stop:1000 length:186 start_codon:yes stop_codon:yes gene_type:complete
MSENLGFNHIDLGTKNMDEARTFYEDVLGFPLVRADLVELGDKGIMSTTFSTSVMVSSWAS